MDFDDFFDENEMKTNANEDIIYGGGSLMIGGAEYKLVNRKLKRELKTIEQNNRMGYIGKKVDDLVEYVEFYKTPVNRSSYIINAITGENYPFLFGSANEKLLFKINMSNELTKTMRLIHNEWIREPSFLYYDSPEQFERHFDWTISDETKKRWLQKKNDYLVAMMATQ
jgi:hypothetical protein